MKAIHVPSVDMRYWLGITFASIFGTNLGDFYAHESGFGLINGVYVLVAIVAVAFLAEQRDSKPHEFYYWFVIIIIRTGATNIADYLAFRIHLPPLPLTLGLAALIAGFAWCASAMSRATRAAPNTMLPDTNAVYWAAMLAAGVFGTVLGDICQHAYGRGTASLGLGVLLAAALFAGRARTGYVAVYWATIAIARTAGTAMGDWLAENKDLNIGLPVSTLLTGIAFVAILVLWRPGRQNPSADVTQRTA